MKYGLIVFKNTTNLGDDIQSYAIKKLLPNVDYYIEREKINEFVSKNNEKVKTIISGWFNHDKLSFPPSPFIEPLFISIHFTDELLGNKPIYFTDYFLNYLKTNEPIGLRDDLVKVYLDENNIKNYFSGCATLTIEKFKDIKKNDNICLVDLDYFITEKIKHDFNNIITKTHYVDEDYTRLSYDERFDYVENLLREYQSSKCVITTRLHCALPCLALGVPVVLIYKESDTDIKNRLSKYTELVNYVSEEEFNKNYKQIIKNITNNKNNFKKYRNKLKQTINTFINTPCSSDNTLNSKLYKEYFVEQKVNLEQIYINKINKLDNLLDERYDLMKLRENDLDKLKLINEGITLENELYKENFDKLSNDFAVTNAQLYKIQNSRTYKVFLKLNKCLNLLRKLKHKLLRR